MSWSEGTSSHSAWRTKSFSHRRGALWLLLGQSSPQGSLRRPASSVSRWDNRSSRQDTCVSTNASRSSASTWDTRASDREGVPSTEREATSAAGVTSVGAVDLAVTVGHGWKGVSHWRPPCVTSPSPLVKVSTRWRQPSAKISTTLLFAGCAPVSTTVAGAMRRCGSRRYCQLTGRVPATRRNVLYKSGRGPRQPLGPRRLSRLLDLPSIE